MIKWPFNEDYFIDEENPKENLESLYYDNLDSINFDDEHFEWLE